MWGGWWSGRLFGEVGWAVGTGMCEENASGREAPCWMGGWVACAECRRRTGWRLAAGQNAHKIFKSKSRMKLAVEPPPAQASQHCCATSGGQAAHERGSARREGPRGWSRQVGGWECGQRQKSVAFDEMAGGSYAPWGGGGGAPWSATTTLWLAMGIKTRHGPTHNACAALGGVEKWCVSEGRGYLEGGK